jgi:hypothetical protein
MKAAWILIILLVAQAVCQAGDTAYQALHLIGGNHEDILNHVIQAEGTDGEPQPAVWRVLIDDPSARGGVREMEMSKGHVISEHTPVRAYAGTGANAIMDFKKLNLDSGGAFTIANQEATKHNVAFNSVDYVLRSDEQTSTPVWILKLIDVKHVLVGTLTIAADTGTVLHTEGFGAPVVQGDVNVPPNNVAPPAPVVAPPPVSMDGDEPPPASGQPTNSYGIGHQIDKGLHRIGGTLQQFFTGKRTVDQRFDNEP